MSRSVIAIAFVTTIVAGCAQTRVSTVTNPSEISVEKALISVAKGLTEFGRELDKEDTQLGVKVDEIKLEFVLAAKGVGKDEVGVDLSHIFAFGKDVGMTTEVTASRGSTLTIVLKRPPGSNQGRWYNHEMIVPGSLIGPWEEPKKR